MADEKQDNKAIEEMQKRLDALMAKNDELLGEIKAERAKRREAEEASANAAEEARKAAEEAAEKAGDVDAVKASLEARHKAALEKAEARAKEAEGQLHKLVIDGGIRDALAQAEIAPTFAKAAGLLFKDGRSIEVKDGEAIVDGVPLADAVKEWAAADGAAFKAAGQASGSGAPGGGKSGGGMLSDMSESDRLKLARENPARLRELRDAG